MFEMAISVQLGGHPNSLKNFASYFKSVRFNVKDALDFLLRKLRQWGAVENLALQVKEVSQIPGRTYNECKLTKPPEPILFPNINTRVSGISVDASEKVWRASPNLEQM